jgi:hypothetical protein
MDMLVFYSTPPSSSNEPRAGVHAKVVSEKSEPEVG